MRNQTNVARAPAVLARDKRWKLLVVAAALTSWAAVSQAAAPPTAQGTIRAKVFTGISGTTVASLTSATKFPDSPDLVRYEPYFELWAGGDINTAPAADNLDNYGSQMVGYFYPPTTGSYIFYICSDDNSALYLSTDDNPANKKLIAQETVYSNAREYTTSAGASDLTAKDSSQFTGSEWTPKNSITLTAGKAYYIEALHKEGTGGDNLSVSIDATYPIPGSDLSPFAPPTIPTILVQPKDAAVVVGGIGVFSVGLDVPPGLTQTIKWTKNGVDIPNSNTNILSLPAAVIGDDQAKIKAIISTSAGTVTSSEATLYVSTIANVFAPGIVKFEAYTDIGGGVNVSDLTSNSKYPNSPDDIKVLTAIDSPNNYGDAYGARVSGYIVAQETGNYFFFLRSDDASQLWLSTDDTTAKAVLIAEETGCCQAFLEPDSTLAAWHDNGSGMGQTTLTPISLTAGKMYAFYALLKEGGGGDYVQVAIRKEGVTTAAASLLPVSGAWIASNAKTGVGDPQITVQPQAPTKPSIEGQTLKLKVDAIVTPAIWGFQPVIQWQKDGNNLIGAVAKTLVVSNTTSADSGTYQAVATAPSGRTATSTGIKITVVPDTFPPVVVGAAAFPNTTKVGVTFDEDLDATSAGSAANYKVNGVAVTAARVRVNVANELSNEKNLVELTVAAPLTSDFTVTVVGVKDVKGNAMTSTDFQGQILSSLTPQDIGSPAGAVGGPDPVLPGSVVVWGPGEFDVHCGGQDYYNNADGFHFIWEKKTNSFDVKVRCVSISPINQWSAVGLMMRESVSQYSREYHNKVVVRADETTFDSGDTAHGSDDYELNGRLATGDPALGEPDNTGPGGSVGWGGTAVNTMNAPNYPNAWVRIAREKTATTDHLKGYGSNDGEEWVLIQDVNLLDAAHAGLLGIDGKPAGPWPDVVLVGPATTAHNNPIGADIAVSDRPKYYVWGVYRDYGDWIAESAPSGPAYAIGLNFGADEPNGGKVGGLAATDVAGVPSVAQSNWNNLSGIAGTNTSIVASAAGASQATATTVTWTCPNTWSTFGRGETNNAFTGADRTLMLGYLDSGDATTNTMVTIKGLPTEMTSSGYDVYVYATGGVGGKGGGYRILNADTMAVLKDYVRAQAPTNATTYVEAVPTTHAGTNVWAVGNYIHFTGLSTPDIIVQGVTASGLGFGSGPRTPINAVQLVAPASTPPAPQLSVARTATGLTITFTGTLQSADTVVGQWTDVGGATSPWSTDATGSEKFYRSKK